MRGGTGDALREARLDAQILDEPSLMELYSHDQARLPKTFRRFVQAPDAVVQPRSAEAVVSALRWCAEHGMAAIARGAGSNAFGGSLPTSRAVTIDMRRMDAVRDVMDDGSAWVEAGATWNRVQFQLEQAGRLPCVHTTSQFSTVGGMVATGGIGLGSTRWGHLREVVEELEVATLDGLVTLDGEEAAAHFRTDGQLGIITAVRIRTRAMPAWTRTVVKQADTYAEALRVARDLAASDGVQTVLVYDAARVHELNRVLGRLIVPERATVIARFEHDVALELAPDDVEPAVAGLLWQQRHFPMRPLKLGPGLLGAELVFPDDVVGSFSAWAKKALAPFGLEPANEAYVLPGGKVLNITTFLTDAEAKGYLLHVAQVQRLTRKAIAMGATPYGGGLWNLATMKHRHPDLKALRRRKHQADPDGVLNPGKSLSPIGGRAGLMLRTPIATWGPSVTRLAAAGARYKARTIRSATTDVPHPGANAPRPLHGPRGGDGLPADDYSHQACTQCAACVPVCPAWQHTGDDRTTARGKLQFMAGLVADPDSSSADEAAALYQCIRCRACEEVCQTDLPLLPAFDALEAKLTDRFGFPRERVATFLAGMEADERAQRVIDETRGIFRATHAVVAGEARSW